MASIALLVLAVGGHGDLTFEAGTCRAGQIRSVVLDSHVVPSGDRQELVLGAVPNSIHPHVVPVTVAVVVVDVEAGAGDLYVVRWIDGMQVPLAVLQDVVPVRVVLAEDEVVTPLQIVLPAGQPAAAGAVLLRQHRAEEPLVGDALVRVE